MLGSVPVGAGYAELLAGASPATGVSLRAEAGYRLREDTSLFAWAEDSARLGPRAGAGVRWEFGRR